MAIKNKHGRTGVKKVRKVLPLDVAQKREAEEREAEERGWHKGLQEGERRAFYLALQMVNAAKSIRAARSAIAKLLEG